MRKYSTIQGLRKIFLRELPTLRKMFFGKLPTLRKILEESFP